MKIGLIINPWAGLGGTVALKGSDGIQIRNEAIKRGAKQRAMEKTLVALKSFVDHSSLQQLDVYWYCPSESMGATALEELNTNNVTVMDVKLPDQTESTHTKLAAKWLKETDVDLILFAGGDGTARDICDVIGTTIPVLGIPAGVKIHSGVFAVTPHAAGEVLAGLVDGRITRLQIEEVKDIDEEAFRNNQVKSKYYGEMNIPVAGEFMQHVKVGGIESEPLVMNEICEWLQEQMQEGVCYLVGSGKTTAQLMEYMSVSNTLLGVDAVINGQLIQADCTARDISELQSNYDCKAILSIIGGQGHIFGRGNAQFNPDIIRKLGKKNILIIGTKAKLKSLEGRPLYVDTSDPKLDKKMAGLITLITGYNDELIYPVVAL